jgi:hypothetical protein
MLTESEIDAWADSIGLNSPARAVVIVTRARGFGNAARDGRNSCHLTPLKTVSPPPAARTFVERIARLYEADPAVLEYWARPFELQVEYRTGAGTHLTAPKVVDFLVIRTTSVALEDWRTEGHLCRAAAATGSYERDEDGGWIAPASRRAAHECGFTHVVRSSSELAWTEPTNASGSAFAATPNGGGAPSDVSSIFREESAKPCQ